APAAAAPEAAPAPQAAAPAAAQASAPASAIASPAAGKILAEKGIDPSNVEGSGRGGRITKGDALPAQSASQKSAPAPAAAPAPAPGGRPAQRVPRRRLRARVGGRLLQAQPENAIRAPLNEGHTQGVRDLRARDEDKVEEEHGVKLGFPSVFVKAAVAALK